MNSRQKRIAIDRMAEETMNGRTSKRRKKISLVIGLLFGCAIGAITFTVAKIALSPEQNASTPRYSKPTHHERGDCDLQWKSVSVLDLITREEIRNKLRPYQYQVVRRCLGNSSCAEEKKCSPLISIRKMIQVSVISANRTSYVPLTTEIVQHSRCSCQ